MRKNEEETSLQPQQRLYMCAVCKRKTSHYYYEEYDVWLCVPCHSRNGVSCHWIRDFTRNENGKRKIKESED